MQRNWKVTTIVHVTNHDLLLEIERRRAEHLQTNTEKYLQREQHAQHIRKELERKKHEQLQEQLARKEEQLQRLRAAMKRKHDEYVRHVQSRMRDHEQRVRAVVEEIETKTRHLEKDIASKEQYHQERLIRVKQLKRSNSEV